MRNMPHFQTPTPALLSATNEYAGLELLQTLRKAQDYLVRLNWQDEVIFPQEAASKNIRQLEKARPGLSEGNITDALKALYRVDNNVRISLRWRSLL